MDAQILYCIYYTVCSLLNKFPVNGKLEKVEQKRTYKLLSKDFDEGAFKYKTKSIQFILILGLGFHICFTLLILTPP